MNPQTIIRQLEVNAQVFAALFNGIEDEQARWKPSPEEWSVLEVAGHLFDEEREDFRQRVDFILHRPADAWPPIHPGAWVTERAYNTRDFGKSVMDFLSERTQSLRWLDALAAPNWAQSHTREGMTMTALDMLAAWLAHDYLHLRQVNELKWKWLARTSGEMPLEYAGGWE